MQKKLIDIYPPKIFEDSSSEELLSDAEISKKKIPFFFSSFKKVWLVLPALVVLFLGIHFLFARTEVTVWPRITELYMQEEIIADKKQKSVDTDRKVIPVKIFEQEKSATKTFTATGKKELEEKAYGTIRVFNNNPSIQTLIANTRFISEDGVLFRSVDRVSVPSAKNGQPGSLDIEVQADQTGSDFNIDPSNFSLPGLAGSPLYTKVYGESLASMQGGAIGETTVVTFADITAAKEQLLTELEVDTKKQLVSRIPSNFVVLEESFETTFLEDNSLVKEGAALENFTFAATIKIGTLAFTKEDGFFLAHHLLESRLAENQKIKDGTFTVDFVVETSSVKAEHMVLRADISSKHYSDVDMFNLAARFQGVSVENVDSILADFPTLAKAEFSLWPFWVQRIPKDPTRLDVILSL